MTKKLAPQKNKNNGVETLHIAPRSATACSSKALIDQEDNMASFVLTRASRPQNF